MGSISYRYSLVDKTPDSQSGKPVSIPGAPYDFDLDFHWLCLLSTVLLYCMTLRYTYMYVRRLIKKNKNKNSSASFLSVQPVRHFCSLAQKMGLKRAYRRLRSTQMADFDLLGNCSG